MRDVKLPKWVQVAGRIAGWLIVLSVAQIFLLPQIGSANPGHGNDYELLLSRNTVYVNAIEYYTFWVSFIVAALLALVFLVSYFSAHFRGDAR